MRSTGMAATLGLLLAAAACDETPVSLRQPASVAVGQTSLSMMVGGQAPVTAQVLDQSGQVIPGLTPAYATDNPAVATVDTAGLVRGMMPGAATITAMYGGSRATVDVTVIPDLRNMVQRVELQADSLVVHVYADLEISVRAFNGLGQPTCPQFHVRSSHLAVAMAQMSGSCRIRLLALFSGETTITAEAEGAVDSMRVRVTSMGMIAFFSARPTSEELVAGATVRYTVSVLDQAVRPVANVAVNFEVPIGTLAATTVRTGTDGTATMQWTIPTHLARLGQTHTIRFRTDLPGEETVNGGNETVFIDGTSVAAIRLYTGDYSDVLRVLEGDSVVLPRGEYLFIGAVGEDPYGNMRRADFTWSVTGPGRLACGTAGTHLSSGIEYVCVTSSVAGAVTLVATAPTGVQRAMTLLFQ